MSKRAREEGEAEINTPSLIEGEKAVVSDNAEAPVNHRRLNRRLRKAAAEHSLSDVKAAIEAGADVNHVDDRGNSTLLWHCRHAPAALDMVKLLVENGADPQAVDDDGVSSLHFAVKGSGADVVRYLLSQAPTLANTPTVAGEMPLMTNCFCANPDAVNIARALLDAGADPNAESDKGWTALHAACGKDSVELVRLLLSRGANVMPGIKRDAPIFIPCARLQEHGVEIVRTFLEAGFPIDCQASGGRSLLDVACPCSSPEMVQLLISHGADVNAPVTVDLIPPIGSAITNVEHGAKIVEILIDNGAEADVIFQGSSLAEHSIFIGNPEVIRTLVRLRPDLRANRAFRDFYAKARFVGNIKEARPWGVDSQTPATYLRGEKIAEQSQFVWSSMRSKRNLDAAMIAEMLDETGDPKVWQYAIEDDWKRLGGGTILHKAVLSTKLSSVDRMQVLKCIAQCYLNPFVLDSDGKTAIEYCDAKKEPEAYVFLQQYQMWSPSREKTRWFGPWFRERAMTTLLCFRQQGFYQKDIRRLIIMYLARTECLFA